MLLGLPLGQQLAGHALGVVQPGLGAASSHTLVGALALFDQSKCPVRAGRFVVQVETLLDLSDRPLPSVAA